MAKIKKTKNVKKVKEDIEILKLQLEARESELSELRRKVEELQNSISYRVGRRIAENKIGNLLKKFLRKYVFK